MHVGWTSWVSLNLLLNISKARKTLLQMHCHVFLNLKTCLWICYVLIVLPLVFYIFLILLILLMLLIVNSCMQSFLLKRMILSLHNYWVSNSKVPMFGFNKSVLKLVVVLLCLYLEIRFCVNLWRILFVQFYLFLLLLLYVLYLLSCTPVHLQVILEPRNFWKWFKNVFTGNICMPLLLLFVKNVLFVRVTKEVLRNQVGYCNQLRTLVNLLSMLLWILSCLCLWVHVDMMLSLASLIDFHVLVVLYLVTPPFLLFKLLIYFLSIGYVALVCLLK